MLKLNKLIILLVLMGFRVSTLQAQTTILDETLLSQASFNTFTPVSVAGAQNWTYSSIYGAVCSGFATGQSFENEDWLVSSAMNLTQMDNVQLTFRHTRGNAAVMNAGVTEGWYKAFATANFTGNPATTQWVELQGVNQNITTAWQYISSGTITIPDAAKSQNSRIAFRYISSASQSATWEIKEVRVTGEPQGNGSSSIFKITNWNTEWLGCTAEGPTDENLQLNNVVAAMLSMNSDVYCLQEISNTTSNPSIATLVSLLGSANWAGAIVPNNTGDCNQRQGIIYKKSKVQLVNSLELSSGNSSQGNSYSYNWSGGRYPAVYNVNFVSGTSLIPVSIVNIHAKAEDGNAASYTRRMGASQALKTLLDGANYNAKNVVVIGDFNDYLIGTSSTACNCSVSPYQNFIADQTNYVGITKDLINVNTNWGVNPIIENVILSNELASNYISSSAAQEVTVSQIIPNYYNTTSNHLPVSARLQFAVLGTPENPNYSENRWTVYPNPVGNQLKFVVSDTTDNPTAEIYDLTGRKLFSGKTNNNSIDVSALPAAIYIVKMGNSSKKFVKQ